MISCIPFVELMKHFLLENPAWSDQLPDAKTQAELVKLKEKQAVFYITANSAISLLSCWVVFF